MRKNKKLNKKEISLPLYLSAGQRSPLYTAVIQLSSCIEKHTRLLVRIATMCVCGVCIYKHMRFLVPRPLRQVRIQKSKILSFILLVLLVCQKYGRILKQKEKKQRIRKREKAQRTPCLVPNVQTQDFLGINLEWFCITA